MGDFGLQPSTALPMLPALAFDGIGTRSTGGPPTFITGDTRGSEYQACSQPENVLDSTALPHTAALCPYSAGTLLQPSQRGTPCL